MSLFRFYVLSGGKEHKMCTFTYCFYVFIFTKSLVKNVIKCEILWFQSQPETQVGADKHSQSSE